MNKQIGGCYGFYRNGAHHTEVKVAYQHQTLEVTVDNRGNGQFETCFSVKKIELPSDYYFGVSSSTGELADDHDLVFLEVYELNSAVSATHVGNNGYSVSSY